MFDPKKISLIVSDLDGTLLLPNSTLGKKTISIIKECCARGLKFMIATGRSVEAAEVYRSELELCGTMIYFNGAEVVDMPSKRILHSNMLPQDAAIICTHIAHEHGVHFQVYFSDDTHGTPNANSANEILFSENPNEFSKIYEDRTGLKFVYGDLLQKLESKDSPRCIKGLFAADEKTIDMLQKKLKERFGNTLNIVKSAPILLEILHPEASKGGALQAALKLHNIKKEEVIAFGDEENDISMLKTAGYAVAPSNAIVEVKALADKIIGSNSEETLALFLEKHFLS